MEMQKQIINSEYSPNADLIILDEIFYVKN